MLTTITLYSQSEKEKVETTITKNKIEGHIYFLADDLLKGRQTGTPENKIAAVYLTNTLILFQHIYIRFKLCMRRYTAWFGYYLTTL